MGRDISVVAANRASQSPTVRAIINADHMVKTGGTYVRFSLLPRKVFLFDKDTEERIPFQAEAVGR